MENPSAVRLVAADRLSGGLIIMFDDGKCAFYSADLLHITLDRAQLLEDSDDGQE